VKMMTRGFMKKTSLTTLVAAAGIFMGNSAYAPAIAADLGDGCCADLEERVAELEATTARKGNRVVSLQVYGNVSRGLLIWDDGVDDDIYNVDNDNQSTKVGFTGSGLMKPGFTAGFQLEFNIQEADSNTVNQLVHDANDDTGSSAGEFDIRYANVYIEGERLGRLTVGHISESTDGIAQINLGGSGVAGDATTAGGFFPRIGFIGDDDLNSTWVSFFVDGDGGRVNGIRYDSPSIYGFILSTSFSEDDRYDVALRFSKEWNSIRFAAGIGYRIEDRDVKSLDTFDPDASFSDVDEVEAVSGSVSVMHVPTGLFVSVQLGSVDTEFQNAADPDDLTADAEMDHWYVQAGVTRNWFGYGNTTIYGAYGENDYSRGGGFLDDAGLVRGNNGFDADGISSIVDVAATQWGFGVVQAFDSAATELFAHYLNYELDDLFTNDAVPLALGSDDFSAVLVGMTVKF